MTTGHRTVTVFLTVLGALMLAIIGLFTHWPWWTWPTEACIVVGVPLMARAIATRKREPFPSHLLQEPDLPVPPVERREVRITGVGLPSLLPDYDFLLTATVRWCPVSVPHGSPIVNNSALAVDAVLTRAARVTADRHPTRASLVQHELNGVLATMKRDATERVEAMALDVTLSLTADDGERLAKLASVRKNEAVWDHERKYEQSRRAYLGDDVLRDTGSAVVWWLHRNEDRIDKAVDDIGLLAELTAAAKNEEVAEHLHRFIPSLSSPSGRDPDDPDLGTSSPGTPPGYDPDGSGSAFRPEHQEPQGPGERAASAFSGLLDAVGLAADSPESLFLAKQTAWTLTDCAPESADEILRRFVTGPSPGDAPHGEETATPGAAHPNGAAPGGPGSGTATPPRATGSP